MLSTNQLGKIAELQDFLNKFNKENGTGLEVSDVTISVREGVPCTAYLKTNSVQVQPTERGKAAQTERILGLDLNDRRQYD